MTVVASRDYDTGAEVCAIGGLLVHACDARVGRAPLQISMMAAAMAGADRGEEDALKTDDVEGAFDEAPSEGNETLLDTGVAPRLVLLATNEASYMAQTAAKDHANLEPALRRDALGCQYVAAVATRARWPRVMRCEV